MTDLFKSSITSAMSFMATILSEPPPVIKDPQTLSIAYLSFHLRNIRQDLHELNNQTIEISRRKKDWSDCFARLTERERATKDKEISDWLIEEKVDDMLRDARARIRELQKMEGNLQYYVDAKKSEETAAAAATTTAEKTVNLPKFDLKKFNGELMDEWFEFWDLFQCSVDADTNLSEVRKHTYLESFLEGEALEVIRGIPKLVGNYRVAVEILQEKYGDKETLIRNLHKELKDLKISRNLEEDQELFLKFETLNRRLDNLGEELDTPQVYLAMEEKLSKKVLEKYLVEKGADKKWNLGKFRAAFKKAISQAQALEEIYGKNHRRDSRGYRKPSEESTMSAVQSNSQKGNSHQQCGFRPSRDRYREERKGEWRSNWEKDGKKEGDVKRSISDERERSDESEKRDWSRSPNEPKFPCVFCYEEHYAINCKNYATLEDRLERLKEFELCRNCFGKFHKEKHCRKQLRKCLFCERSSHQPSLCEECFGENKINSAADNTSDTNVISESSSESGDEAIAEQSSSASVAVVGKQEEKKRALMMSKMVTLYNPICPKKRKKVLAFIDNGSDGTYVSKKLVKELQLGVIGKEKVKMFGFGGKLLSEENRFKYEIGIHKGQLDMLMRCKGTEKCVNSLPFIDLHGVCQKELRKTRIDIPLAKKEPDILIGIDYFHQLDIFNIEKLPSGFVISNSKIGKLISGKGQLDISKSRKVSEEKSKKSMNAISSAVMNVEMNENEEYDMIEDEEKRELVEQKGSSQSSENPNPFHQQGKDRLKTIWNKNLKVIENNIHESLLKNAIQARFKRARWISFDQLIIFPCVEIRNYSIISSRQILQILQVNSEEGPCEIFRYLSLYLHQNLIRVDQWNNESELISIQILNVDSQLSERKLPDLPLQIFRKLFINKLPPGQLELVKLIESVKASQTNSFTSNPSESFMEKLGGNIIPDLGILKIFVDWSWEKFLTRIVVGSVLARLGNFIFTKIYFKFWIKRELKKEMTIGKYKEVKLEELDTNASPPSEWPGPHVRFQGYRHSEEECPTASTHGERTADRNRREEAMARANIF